VKHWTNDERTEYSELLDGVLSEAETSRDRTALMVARVDDAIQAHRAWAREIAAEARQRGHASQWKSHAKKARVLVSYSGEVLSKPRVIGVKRQKSGQVIDQQALIEFLTFDELRAKRTAYVQQVKSYSESIALMDRLIALQEMSGASDAETPDQAAARLGLTLDDYLGQAA